MEIILIITIVVLLIVLFVGIFYMLQRYFLVRQRLEKISSPYQVSRIKEELSAQEKIKKQYVLNVVHIFNHLKVLDYESTKTYAKQLANAGWLDKNSLIIFMSTQLLVLGVGFFLSLMLVTLIPWFASKSFSFKGVVVILLTWIGYRFPDLFLKRAIARYRRKLRHSFLDFLDLFLICIEAGFSNDKALDRVSKELRQLHPELMEQISLLTTELSILPERRMAWENFAERTGIEETKLITQVINQSEQLGSSMGQTLRVQADMFRSEKLSLIEQKAMRLPTLLTLPLVTLILPALLLILLGPSILSIMDMFEKMY